MTLSRQFPRVSGHLLDDAFQEGLFELSWRLDDLDFYPGTNPIAHAEAKSSWAIRNFLFHKVSSGISVHRWVVTRPRDFERGSFFDDDDDDHAVDRSVLDAILDRSVQTNLDTGALLDMYRLVLKSYFRLLRCCFFHRLTGAGAKLFDFVFQFYVVTGGHFPSIFVVRDRFCSTLKAPSKFSLKGEDLYLEMSPTQYHVLLEPFLGDFFETLRAESPIVDVVLNYADSLKNKPKTAKQDVIAKRDRHEAGDYNPAHTHFISDEIQVTPNAFGDDEYSVSRIIGESRNSDRELPIALADLSSKAIAEYLIGKKSSTAAATTELANEGFNRQRIAEIMVVMKAMSSAKAFPNSQRKTGTSRPDGINFNFK
jgi:hypothetical protein